MLVGDRRHADLSPIPTRPPSSSAWWSSNYETISLMRQALIALQDTEIGQRAYLLTGDIANLEPYERARLRIETELRQLEAAVGRRSRRDCARSPEFRAAANEKLERAQRHHRRLSALRPRRGAGAGAHRSRPRDHATSIRQVANAFIEGQRLLLARRLAAAALGAGAVRHRRRCWCMGGAFLCLIVGMYIDRARRRPAGGGAARAGGPHPAAADDAGEPCRTRSS